MASQQGADGSSDGGLLAVESPQGLALLQVPATGEPRHGVLFDGIALGPGVYMDAAGRRVRVREAHLPLVAQRLPGVFLRDLHREDLGASIGIVAAARVDAGEVRFTGDVRLAPYVELVRHFWPHIRFSLGFRYDPTKLGPNEDGTYDLPSDFLIDHLALVPQGQYPNAKLVRLLNQARGLVVQSSVVRRSGEASAEPTCSGELQRADVIAPGAPASPAAPGQPAPGALRGNGSGASPSPAAPATAGPQASLAAPAAALGAPKAAGRPPTPGRQGAPAGSSVARPRPPPNVQSPSLSGGTPMLAETENPDQLRQQRDDALRAAEQSKTDLEQARGDLGKAKADLEAANRLAEAARLELGQAKNRLAAEVMKLELGAGKDFDLDQRKKDLTGMDLAGLDRLRGELRLSAAAAAEAGEETGRPPPGPVTSAAAPDAGGAPATEAMDLQALGLNDALRLAFRQGVF